MVLAAMVYLVLGLWLLIGLAVFFVAMRGGPGRARARRERAEQGVESKASNRLLALGVVIVFAFGLAVPAIVLWANDAHKSGTAAGGVHLTASEQKGRELFAHSCVYCHTLAAVQSYGRVGPNLDVRVGDDIATSSGRKALVLNAITEGRARGLGQMPAQLYVGKEAEEVAAFVAAVAGH